MTAVTRPSPLSPSSISSFGSSPSTPSLPPPSSPPARYALPPCVGAGAQLALLSAALEASQAARDRVFMTCHGCGWQQHIRRSRCSHCGAAKVVATEPKRKKKRKRPSAAAAAAAAAAASAAGEPLPPPPGTLSIELSNDDGNDNGEDDGGPAAVIGSSTSGDSCGGDGVGNASTTTTTKQKHPPRRRPATVDVVVVPNKAAAEARIVCHVAHLSSVLGDAPPRPPATPAGRGQRAVSARATADDMSPLTLGWSASCEAAASSPPPAPLRPAKRRAVVKVEVPPVGEAEGPPARWGGGPDAPVWEGLPLEPLLDPTADTLDGWSERSGSDADDLPAAASPQPDCLLLPPASVASPRGICDPVFEVLGDDDQPLGGGGAGGDAEGLCGLFETLPDLSSDSFF